jgi:putative ABC transport system substrate-binding protein
MAQDSDPIGNGYVASLARPGGNVTGLSRLAPELSGKQVELLREVVPGLTRLAVLVNSTPRANVLAMKEIESAAAALKIRVQYLDVVGPSDFETVFHDAAKQHADAALWLIGGNIASIHRKSIADFAIKSRLPVVYEQRAAVEAGGLRSYGVNFSDLDRRGRLC